MKRFFLMRLYILLALGIIALGIGFTKLSLVESLRIVYGSLYVLFIPGYIISYIFFKNEIDNLERIALSFALSIAIVPLIIFYLNLIGLKINLLNSSLTILGIIVISLVILYFKNKRKSKKRR